VRRSRRRTAASGEVIEASSGRLPLDVLIGLGAGSEEHIDGRHSHHDHHHDDDDHDDHDHDAFDSISIDLPGPTKACCSTP
jgi:cobalamin biosynthesis protein CobW